MMTARPNYYKENRASAHHAKAGKPHVGNAKALVGIHDPELQNRHRYDKKQHNKNRTGDPQGIDSPDLAIEVFSFHQAAKQPSLSLQGI